VALLRAGIEDTVDIEKFNLHAKPTSTQY